MASFIGARSAWETIDGSLNPATGAANVPALLNGYAKRPPWRVAGVDYRVGLPETWSSTDWVTWAVANSSFVTIRDSLNAVVSGGNFSGKTPPYKCFIVGVPTSSLIADIDFSSSAQGAATLRLSANYGNPTLRRCKILGGLNGGICLTTALGSTGNITVEYCELDGEVATVTGTIGHILSPAGGGTFLYQYNDIKNPPSGVWIHNPIHTSVIQKYNLIRYAVDAPGGTHNGLTSWTASAGGGPVTYQGDFNTVYAPPNSNNGLADIFELASTNGSTTVAFEMGSPKVRNNTIATVGPSAATYAFQGPNNVVSDPTHGLNTVTGDAQVSNNYVDLSGLIGAYHSSTGWGTTAFSGNFDMATGNAIAAP